MNYFTFNLPAQHTGVTIFAVKVEGIGKLSAFQFCQQCLSVGIEMFPGAVPGTPTPASGPFNEKSIGQGGVMSKITGLDMTYPLFITISFQGIIHELQEMRGHDEVVFQYDDTTVTVYLGCHSIDDTTGESPVSARSVMVIFLNPCIDRIKARTSLRQPVMFRLLPHPNR